VATITVIGLAGGRPVHCIHDLLVDLACDVAEPHVSDRLRYLGLRRLEKLLDLLLTWARLPFKNWATTLSMSHRRRQKYAVRACGTPAARLAMLMACPAGWLACRPATQWADCGASLRGALASVRRCS